VFQKIINFFTTNITAKLLALLFALGIWMYVAAGESRVDKFPGRIPIEPKNVPVGMAIADDLGSVEVKIKASYSSWQHLSIDKFTASVDLAGLGTGTYRTDVDVKVSDPAVSVVEKNPSKVTVSLEPLTTKKVPITVRIEGKTGSGFAAGEATTDPSELEVKGAKSLVDNILSASVMVKLNGETTDLDSKVRPTAFDANGKEIRGIIFTPDSVLVKVPISRATNTKTVGIKVSVTGDPKENYWISKIIVTPSVAVVTSEPEQLKDLEYLETVKIDISGIFKTLNKDVDLILPEGIALLSNQRQVKVSVYVAPNLTAKEIPATLVYKGKMGSTSSTVKVKVTGPISSLNNLYSRDVVINIDLSGRSSGSYTIDRGSITVPSGIDIIDYSPKTINIIIE
jgi:YbbR domain-containing protein